MKGNESLNVHENKQFLYIRTYAEKGQSYSEIKNAQVKSRI